MSLVLLAVAVTAVLGGLSVLDAAIYVAAGMEASTAADAAALAAAPQTFGDFGGTAAPVREAQRLAAANGAVLESCRCPPDDTWRPRTVEVVVRRRVRLVVFGERWVRAVGRAVFDPTRLA